MADLSFDTNLNTTLHENVQDNMGLSVGDLVGGTVASVVDFGASVWNSLPGTTNVETGDLLKDLNNDAFNVYQKSPDLIHAASFIGGMFVPMGLAAKGMTAMRAGVKGMDWFSSAGRTASLEAVASQFAQSGAETTAYRSMLKSIYAKTAVNQAIDAVAMEAALVTTMHAHPLMEDYMKEPAKNFALSAAFGGVIGGTIGVIAERAAVKGVVAPVATRIWDDTVGKMIPVIPSATNATNLGIHQLNINSLDSIMETLGTAGKTETNDFTFAAAKLLKQNSIVEQNTLFDAMVSPEIKALPAEQKTELFTKIANDPAMFGIENIRLLTEKDLAAEGLVTAPKLGLEAQPSLIKISSKGPSLPVAKTAVYYPELNLFGTKDDAIHYATAAALGKTEGQLEKALPFNYGRIPNYDSALELIGKSSADVQAEHIGAMLRFQKMSLKDLEAVHLYEGDLPALNGLLYRMNQDPEAAKLAIRISDREAANKVILQNRTEEMIASGQATAGPDSGYLAGLEKIKERLNKFGSPMPSDPNPDSLLRSWIGGDKISLSRMAVEHHAREVGGFSRAGVNIKKANDFDEIYNSVESKQLRDQFTKIADTNGDVYLYRGWKTNQIRGAQPLDSYAVSPQKAAQFTGANTYNGVKLYKVSVNDIVAGFRDVGNGTDNAEIIVRAGARPVQAEYSDAGKLTSAKTPAGTVVKTAVTSSQESTAASTKFGYDDIKSLFTSAKKDAIDTLIANGIPAESIAIKTNTPTGLVKSYMVNSEIIDKAVEAGGVNLLNHLTTSEEIKGALQAKNQPWVLSGNIRKPTYITNTVGLNNRTLSNMDTEFKRVLMLQSKSSVSTDMANFLDDYKSYIDILKSQIGAVNNASAGSRFFNSFDHWSKDMQQAGMIGSVFGKEFQNIGNRTLNRILEPVKMRMSTIAKDEAAVLEFNTAMDTNAGLSGWRSWGEDGKLYQKATEIGEDGKPVQVLKAVKNPYGEGDYQIKTPGVIQLVKDLQDKSPELRNLANTIAKIQGKPDVNDIGFWVPSFNPVNKFIAYVHNEAEDTVKMLWGRNPQEFNDVVNSYKQHLAETGQQGIQVYKKGEQEFWNVLNDRLDTVNMQRADQGQLKKGKTTSAIVKSDLTIFSEIIGGYEHYVASQTRNLADLALSDITDSLRRMSAVNTAATEAQPLDKIKTVISKQDDAAKTFHNALLGNTNLGEYTGWQSANRTFETYLNVASNFISDTFKTVTKGVSLVTKNGEIDQAAINKIDYKALDDALKARGIINPYEQFEKAAPEKFGLSKLAESQDSAKRIIYASNALIATAALRFGEIAQPLVNALSLPILTSLAIADRMPATFLGIAKGTAKVAPTEVMMEGIRMMNSDAFKGLNQKWEKLGYFEPKVSEVSDLMRATRQFEKGPTAAIENAVNSNLVNLISKPSDYVESLTRKAAMNTGAAVAKRLYPELDEQGITIFARDFMDKAIGNFHSSQRPVFFQGTLGAALGIFQTYSLTLGQSIYRHLELKNYKALGKAALLQSTIFGTKSLPGFDLVSNAIGEHFSDEHFDLETGTYRAVTDPAARWLLYGLPSNLGPSITSRGDVNPRLPIINDTVAYNFVKQTGAMFGEVQRALQSDAPNMGRALLQALSLQSMSRPLARTAELATGYSVTKAGNTVQIPEEVWTPTGIFARILATRPIEEQQLRDLDHLNRFYGAADRSNRHEATESLKTAIRNGSLSDTALAEIADKYMKANGSPTGWRSTVNTAIGKTETSGKETFIQKLKPNSPFMFMMDSFDGE